MPSNPSLRRLRPWRLIGPALVLIASAATPPHAAAARQAGDDPCAVPFAAPWDLLVGEGPDSIAVCDFNRDGRDDVAVANQLGDTLTVAVSRPGGGLETLEIEFPARTRPSKVVIADFNGDARPDLVYLRDSVRQLDMRPGDGLGGFGLPVTSSSGVSVSDLASADFDGDGDVDLVARAGGGLRFLFNDGQGFFELTDQFLSASFFLRPALGDADGDGDIDIAVPIFTLDGAWLRVYANDGTGEFGRFDEYPVSATPEAVAFGDVDGDGDQDLIWTLQSSGLLCTRLNEGGVFVNEQCSPGGLSLRAIVATDLDGDGDADVAAADFFNDRVLLLESRGNGRFSTGMPIDVGSEPTILATGDLNGDGSPDVLCVNLRDRDVTMLVSDGTAGFALPGFVPTTVPQGLGLIDATAGDLDGDGDADVLIAVSRNPRVDVLEQTDAGLAHARSLPLRGGALRSRLADLDLDGDLDAVVLTDIGVDEQFEVLTNTGGGDLRWAWAFEAELPGVDFDLVDADDDGAPDIVALLDRDRVLVAYNDGTGAFDDRLVLRVDDRSDSLVAGDLDGDDQLDVAIIAGALEQGSTVFELVDRELNARSNHPVPPRTDLLAIDDVDGDGLADLITTESLVGSLAYLPGDGMGGLGGGLGTRRDLATGRAISRVQSTDINGDCVPDLVAAGNGGLQILTGVGGGGFSIGPILRTGRTMVGFALADLNGDGRTDIATTDTRNPDLPVLFNRCPRTCRADIDGDGELSVFDLLAFQRLFALGDARTDFDGDGQPTIFDFLVFQNEFDAGCP